LKALIFAAGLGTRLKPLTDHLPKALVQVGNKPLLEHVILKLKQAGFHEIIVNVHHFPEMIIDFLLSKDNFGIRIEISDERDMLLDTGGGIKKTAWFLEDGKPFLVHNVDIFSNVDLKALYSEHLVSERLATLVVSPRDTFRHLLFDENNVLRGWINEQTGTLKPAGLTQLEKYQKLAFSGIQIIDPKVFKLMEKYNSRFKIIDFYLNHVETEKIMAYKQPGFRMLDIGKIQVIDEIRNGLPLTDFFV
jgi:NDP-sugar pyrophosphorylase family protein